MIKNFYGKTINGVTIRDGEQVLFNGKPAMLKVVDGKGLVVFQINGMWRDNFPMHAEEAAWHTERIISLGGGWVGNEYVTTPLLSANTDSSTHIDYDTVAQDYADMMSR